MEIWPHIIKKKTHIQKNPQTNKETDSAKRTHSEIIRFKLVSPGLQARVYSEDSKSVRERSDKTAVAMSCVFLHCNQSNISISCPTIEQSSTCKLLRLSSKTTTAHLPCKLNGYSHICSLSVIARYSKKRQKISPLFFPIFLK